MSKWRTLLIAASLLLGCAGLCDAQEYSWLAAPPFGIDFDPNRFRFEPAPTKVYECEDLGDRRGLLFVFGKVHADKVEYYLISGWVRGGEDSPTPGPPRFENEADEGILVVLSQGGCRLDVLAAALSPDEISRRRAEKVGFNRKIVTALIDDAIERQIRTFGGRDNFLCQPAIARTKSPWSPLLREKLDQLGKPARPCE